MIDSESYLRCDGCNKKLARYTVNMDLEIVCPRSTCKRFNIFKRKDLLQALTRFVKRVCYNEVAP